MALGGGLIGWFLRSLKARGELARVRGVVVDQGEVGRLRGRLANLEPAVAERDRLRMELADIRGRSAGALGFASDTMSDIGTDTVTDIGTDTTSDIGTDIGTGTRTDDGATTTSDIGAGQPPPDVAAAAAVLGRAIELDDLTVVEGIGPKIARLCGGIGVATWRQLADVEVGVLQSMLDAAGPRFRMHKPETWPQQAGLLAEGRWGDFKELIDGLGAG
jgi:predicted flap endonuclease-1-like 5' DNA nuclease